MNDNKHANVHIIFAQPFAAGGANHKQIRGSPRRAPSAERRGGFVCLAHTEACRFLALLTYFLTNLLQIPKVQPRNSMNVL